MEKEMMEALDTLEASLARVETAVAWRDLFVAERAAAGPNSPRFHNRSEEDLFVEADRFCSQWWNTWALIDKAPQAAKKKWQARFVKASARYRMLVDETASLISA